MQSLSGKKKGKSGQEGAVRIYETWPNVNQQRLKGTHDREMYCQVSKDIIK
jgi:hypothetical protein